MAITLPPRVASAARN